jgi:segregation and condensation protein A
MSASPDDYRVQLEAYAGPLDLLLHLVKRNEVDLHEIPIARLTDQYLAHLRVLETLDMDQAGEFLVLAATLLEIKSKLIQPGEEQEESAQDDGQDEAEAALDPRYELVQQLLAYKQYKDAANHLEQLHADWAARFEAGAATPSRPDDQAENAPPREHELEDLSLMDLCEAFGRILNSIGQASDHQVTYDDTPIALHAEDVADRLSREGPMTLQTLIAGRSNRGEAAGLFLATLELVRDKRVRVHQEEIAGPITLELVPESERRQLAEADEEPTDWTDPKTGRIEYEWPEAQARQNAQRRGRIRLGRRFGQGQGEGEEDDKDGGDSASAGASEAEAEGETDILQSELIRRAAGSLDAAPGKE